MKRSSYGERDYAFGQMVLKLRTHIGLTQAGLAERLRVSRRAVAQWEAGSTYPKAEHLKELIALGVRASAFPAGREVEEVRTLWLWDVERASYRTVLHGHTDVVSDIVFTPDSRSLLSGSEDNTMRVWDVEYGQCARIMQSYAVSLNDIAWSPDGRLLASGGGRGSGELFVWEVQSGERLYTLHEPSAMINALAWGPAGSVLVCGGGDGMLRWWDLQHGECVRVRKAHQGAVQSLKSSLDGGRLASCGDDGAIQVWGLESGEHVRTLRRDRPYERLNITGIRGLTEAQKATLRALGAVEERGGLLKE